MLSLDEHEHTDSHGATLTRFGRYLWIADRMGNRMIVIDTWTDELANEIPLVGPLVERSGARPDGRLAARRQGVRLAARRDPAVRRPARLDRQHAGPVRDQGVEDAAAAGEIESIARIANVDTAGVDRADPHALRVRELSPRWAG